MALAIETERLTLRLRDEHDAGWYRELTGERSQEMPTLLSFLVPDTALDNRR